MNEYAGMLITCALNLMLQEKSKNGREYRTK